jgi:hypothetical protein
MFNDLFKFKSLIYYINFGLYWIFQKWIIIDRIIFIQACRKIWQLSDSYERYMGYVTCVKTALGEISKIKIRKINYV